MNPSPSLLEVRSLTKTYVRGGPLSGKRIRIQALDGVTLAIQQGSIFALVGESGSGKSTLAKCLVGLEEPDSGDIKFEDHSLFSSGRPRTRHARPELQLIFQDAATSFNSRFSVAEIIAEPLFIQRRGTLNDQTRRVSGLMAQTGLPPGAASRSAFELSGGERQRLAIARALAAQPKFLILDEALSGLDLPVQRQITSMLLEVQSQASLTYLVISHDLGLVAQIADYVAVMHQGKIVEEGPARDVFAGPRHPHTRALVAAAPVLEHCSAVEEA